MLRLRIEERRARRDLRGEGEKGMRIAALEGGGLEAERRARVGTFKTFKMFKAFKSSEDSLFQGRVERRRSRSKRSNRSMILGHGLSDEHAHAS